MAPSIVESSVNFFIPHKFDSSWEVEGKSNLWGRDSTNNDGNMHSMLEVGRIVAIVAPMVLVVLGLLSWGIYAYRRRLRSKRTRLPRKVGYPKALSKKATLDLSTSKSQGTFLVALPTSSQDITANGQSVTVGIPSDKPQVLYVMPGENPSSAPLKKGNEGSHNITPTLKIDTSALKPPLQGQVSSPSLSSRTTASKSPSRLSTSRSTKSDSSGKPHRLVVVESTFPPSLPDELEIQVGEYLYLIEEYEDEWCLVQRVGSKEKGVIPRLCVIEKDRTPSTKSRNVFRF